MSDTTQHCAACLAHADQTKFTQDALAALIEAVDTFLQDRGDAHAAFRRLAQAEGTARADLTISGLHLGAS